jgi:pimeloyl-ACP methyl ester carboxylesterase
MSLVINGTNEQALDYVVAPFFTNIPKAKWVKFAQSTHTPFWEERERYVQIIADFLAL